MKRTLRLWGLALLAVVQACGNEPSTSPARSLGNLTATIGGLPPGVDAAVTVTGPSGFSRVVTATETLTDLTPGGYTVSATDVASGGHRYAPGTLSQTVQVAADLTTQVQVAYEVINGCRASVRHGGLKIPAFVLSMNANIPVFINDIISAFLITIYY